MKRPTLLLALTCALLPHSGAMAQTTLTSSTPVIGFYKFDVPVGTSAWTCGLVTKKQFQGAMSSTLPSGSKSTVNVSTATWQPGAFSLHYVEILSGPQEGLIIDIDPTTPNTATQLTVIGKTSGPNGLGLTGTENFCIRKHATLATVFKSGGGLAAYTDYVTLIDGNGLEKAFGYSGTQWFDGGFSIPSNNQIIYPGQGFLITSESAIQITFGGDEVAYVKSGPLKVPVYANKRNLVGVLSPVVSTNPLDSAYPSSSVPGSSLGLVAFLEPYTDVINTFTTDGLFADDAVFGSNGSTLVDGGFFLDRSSTPFRNGSVFAITPQVDSLYTQPALVP